VQISKCENEEMGTDEFCKVALISATLFANLLIFTFAH